MDAIRSAPAWLIIAVAVLIIVILIGSLPFAGWMIERKRRRDAAQVRLVDSGEGFFSGQPDISRYEGRPRSAPQRFGAVDVTFAGQPLVDSSPTRVIGQIFTAPTLIEAEDEDLGPDWTPEPEDDWMPNVEPDEPDEDETEPETEEIISIEEDRTEPMETADGRELRTPRWAEPTAGWSVIEEWESELKESEAAALAAFRADPLEAWFVPESLITESVSQYLPEADRAFTAMYLGGRLTGVGANIDSSWRSWDLEGAAR